MARARTARCGLRDGRDPVHGVPERCPAAVAYCARSIARRSSSAAQRARRRALLPHRPVPGSPAGRPRRRAEPDRARRGAPAGVSAGFGDPGDGIGKQRHPRQRPLPRRGIPVPAEAARRREPATGPRRGRVRADRDRRDPSGDPDEPSDAGARGRHGHQHRHGPAGPDRRRARQVRELPGPGPQLRFPGAGARHAAAARAAPGAAACRRRGPSPWTSSRRAFRRGSDWWRTPSTRSIRCLPTSAGWRRSSTRCRRRRTWCSRVA